MLAQQDQGRNERGSVRHLFSYQQFPPCEIRLQRTQYNHTKTLRTCRTQHTLDTLRDRDERLCWAHGRQCSGGAPSGRERTRERERRARRYRPPSLSPLPTLSHHTKSTLSTLFSLSVTTQRRRGERERENGMLSIRSLRCGMSLSCAQL